MGAISGRGLLRKSLAHYIIGLMAVCIMAASLMDYYAERLSQREVLRIYKDSKDRDIRFVIQSLVDREVESLQALAMSLREREDLVVDIAVSDARGKYIGAIEDTMKRIARDLGLEIFIVTDTAGRIIYSTASPQSRGGGEPHHGRGQGSGVTLTTLWGGVALMAREPAMVGREVVGTIYIGARLDDRMAAMLASATDVEITLATPTQIVASSLAEGDRGRISMDTAREALGQGRLIPMDHRTGAQGEPRVAYYGAIDVAGTPLILIEEFDIEEFRTLNSASNARHMRMMALFVLVAIALSALLAMYLVAPLRRLRERASSVVQEITGERVERERGDEIQSLVRAFNLMLATIRRSMADNERMQQGLMQAKQDWENTFNSIGDMITIQDNEFNIIAANRPAEAGMGIHESPEKRNKCYAYLHGETSPVAGCPSCECIASGRSATLERFEPHLDRHVEVRAIPRLDPGGEVTGIIHIVRDITSRKKMEEQLVRQALYDPLTKLPNRVLFMDRLENLFAHRRRDHGLVFALLFIDLDHFKKINDSLGHLVGDKLLISVAQRLEYSVRPGDTVSRFGGDEFVIILDSIGGQQDAVEITGRIQRELKRPFTLGGTEVFTSASIGIAMIADRYERPEDFLRDADTAMYSAKALGRATEAVFDETMHSVAVESMMLENDLRRALERREFVLHYQPVVNLDTGRVSGFEALIRWDHPVQGLLAPQRFIPMAEETGLINAIGEWVLRQACSQMRVWLRMFPADPPLTMSVNLSARQFNQRLPELVTTILEDEGLSPGSLKLEITESVLMANSCMAQDVIERLKAMGVGVYLDDFGTGYSSLNYIHKFPVGALKIDRSFVKDIGRDPQAQEIVKAITLLAENLNMVMIVEGVEDIEQLEIFRSFNCRFSQGFLFSEPLGSREMEGYMMNYSLSDIVR